VKSGFTAENAENAGAEMTKNQKVFLGVLGGLGGKNAISQR
jgi:hypothetical protein